ncbi:transporter substrate-binding domain-containing protein [Thalassospira sp. A3_1]|uniref:transporter substrate-binding domain-containing protein n=1 Tax=Thalassospira sp. A3_1 TaxID=2821088 RepID=UPI001ADBFCBA|nr:transporter substrate-binding domain-containing protein [Thalassospira sp. A3_1]MBO9508051.1 transporter substrate-binding domain-containing protein [Thalassospira sp. A3_1]
MNKFLKSTIAAIVMIAAPLAGASAGALDTIKEAGVLKVAVPQDFPPFGTVGADMQPKGYDIDMAALIADDLGVKLELVPVASSNRIPYLTTGKVDLVISSLGKNPDREKVIDFTDPYAPFYNGVFGPADIAVKGAEDLAGHSVGVTRGAIEDLELTKIAPADLEIKRYEDNNGTISAFLSGQVDLIATGNVTAAAIIERNPPRKPEPKFLIKNSPCYVGLNKEEDAFKARVNEIIAASIADGRLNAIAEKWLGIPLPEKL